VKKYGFAAGVSAGAKTLEVINAPILETEAGRSMASNGKV
jgi:hypothetical protein